MMSDDHEIIVMNEENQVASVEFGMAGALKQISEALQALADVTRTTNERMTLLERQVALLTKVTSAQARELGVAIRARAEELALMYAIPGGITALSNAIRRDIRMTAGVTGMRELPRCEFRVYMQQVEMWDDYKTVKAIKKGTTNA